jgi:5-histidylcysteine sulfoxide synthase/putative 4-mercaptohistidine N1-methyltranferase
MKLADGMKSASTFLLSKTSASDFRQQLRHYFEQTWATYERLFETIKDDSNYYQRPCLLRHPLIFYFGHTATFFVNKLVLAKQLNRVNPVFESMFAIGVDEMSWDDLNDAHYAWPTVDAVRDYRAQVKQHLLTLIERVEIDFPINWQSPVWSIVMGIEHERIHLETSSVLIRQLPFDAVQAHDGFPICPQQQTPVPVNGWVDVPAGRVSINHQDPARLYGWDNEYGQHSSEVGAFKAANMLVSNGEFLAFVEANGYQTTRYWTEEGQGWLAFSQAQYPTFWLKKGDDFYLRTLTDQIAMPWSWPAEVNYLEAKAFCNWKAEQTGEPIRLPSEDEYLLLRNQCALPDSDSAIGIGANINLEQYASSTPVDANRFGEVYDIVGNVWQWTETPIYPFDGFKVHPLYDDFTTPTFDNKHNIFKGGSWISTGNEANLHSRYAFRRHFFQHAGFRYIASSHPVVTHYNPYETQTDVVQACDAHYGASVFTLPNYPQSLADVVKQAQPHGGALLEVGCSVGRCCLALAPHFEQVTGLDRSARFIQVANQMKSEGRIRYRLSLEGDIPDFVERSLQEVGLIQADNVHFLQQDANNLKAMFTNYDVIILNQTLAKLTKPIDFLIDIHQRLNSGGLLVISSHYPSDDASQSLNDKLGGFKRNGENVSSLETISEQLSAHFVRVADPIDLPLLQRDDARHYQLVVNQVTLWRKTS